MSESEDDSDESESEDDTLMTDEDYEHRHGGTRTGRREQTWPNCARNRENGDGE